MKKLLGTISSLRITVVLLLLCIVVVFIGTVAQADEGLYQAQARYFKSWSIHGFSFFGTKQPYWLPGGHLLGLLLVVNMSAAFIHRFQWKKSKLGIHLTHIGVLVLMVGQLVTDTVSVENYLFFREGGTSRYVESHTEYELVFVRDADAENEEVVAIPQAMLKGGEVLRHDRLPFTVKQEAGGPNAFVRARGPAIDGDKPVHGTKGVGPSVVILEQPEVRDTESRNMPWAVVHLSQNGASLGSWLIHPDPAMPEQEVPGGWKIKLRGERSYFGKGLTKDAFSVTLLKTTHEIYPGTEIPKNFMSRVRISNPVTNENREVEISMNAPLRYQGLAFYQHQMGRIAEDPNSPKTSTLQVVANPSWVAPYVGCIVVALGMLIQFIGRLLRWTDRENAKASSSK